MGDKVEIDRQSIFLQQEFDKEFLGSVEISLHDKYENFAQEYAKCGNATEAYIRTYGNIRAKRKTISERVSRLLREKPIIKERIAQIRKDALRRNVMSLEESLTILTDIARTEKNQNPQVARAAANDIKEFYIKAKEGKLKVEIKGSVTNTISEETVSAIVEAFGGGQS